MKTPLQIAGHLERLIHSALENRHVAGLNADVVEAQVRTYMSVWSFAVGREEEFQFVLTSIVGSHGHGAAQVFRKENPVANEEQVLSFVISRYRQIAEAMQIPFGPVQADLAPNPELGLATAAIQAQPAQVTAPTEKTYSVPRRFGIAAVFGVATAFGVLIWIMQMFDAPPPLIVAMAIYLAIVGGMQAVFNKSPRGASIITGGVCTAGFFLYMMLTEGAPPSVLVCSLPFTALLGLGVGYCGGVVVAGVFLVMDGVTSAMAKKLDKEEEKDKSPFDEATEGNS